MASWIRPKSEWLCLFTQPHREGLAISSLREAGFETFFPTYRKLVLRRGKRVAVRAPLFSRYVFARAGGENASLFSAHRMRGVSSFAGRTLEQSFVSGDVMDMIRSRQDEDGDVVLDAPRLKPGQMVKLMDGPFAGLQAVFDELNDRRRCYILLDLLGKTHRILVRHSALEIAA